jgi:hypothetical protein
MKARNVTLAIAEARDLPQLSLSDALALLVLIAEKEPRLYERAAVRWAGRFLLERRPTLAEAELALAALGTARGEHRSVAVSVLRTLVQG